MWEPLKGLWAIDRDKLEYAIFAQGFNEVQVEYQIEYISFMYKVILELISGSILLADFEGEFRVIFEWFSGKFRVNCGWNFRVNSRVDF